MILWDYAREVKHLFYFLNLEPMHNINRYIHLCTMGEIEADTLHVKALLWTKGKLKSANSVRFPTIASYILEHTSFFVLLILQYGRKGALAGRARA